MVRIVTRHLEWEGLFNARDLGGLAAAGGRTTRRGALVRSENLDRLAPAGWQRLREHGVRTVVDLRNHDQGAAALDDAVTGVRTVRVPLEGDHELDPEFWRVYEPELSCTPLYYRPFLERLPQRAAAVVAVIADAEQGGVLVHCAAGRDRTGLVVALLLALVGVDAAIIAADHELSAERAAAGYAFHQRPDETPAVRAVLDRHGIGWQAALIAALDGLDVETLLLDAGVTRSQLAAVRARLLDAPVLIGR